MAEKSSLEKTIDKIKDCSFDTDKESNFSKSKVLTDIQILIRKKKFTLEQEVNKMKNELLVSDDIQKSKGTKDVKQAKIELELAGDISYEKVKEYNLLLNIIHIVEAHNEKVISMYFN